MKAAVLTMTLVMVLSCQTVPVNDTASDRNYLGLILSEWKKGFDERDIYSLIPIYSEHYLSLEGRGKDEELQEIEKLFDKADEIGLRVDMLSGNLALADEKATFSPVYITSTHGQLKIALHFKKEKDGVWRIALTSRGKGECINEKTITVIE